MDRKRRRGSVMDVLQSGSGVHIHDIFHEQVRDPRSFFVDAMEDGSNE